MTFLYLKALHIVFIVTWFAGLFYIPRIFIYHVEADQKPEPERSILINQFKMMAKRLWYIIAWPSAIITLILGGFLLLVPPVSYFKTMPSWLWIKIILAAGLLVYHHFLHFTFKQLQNDVVKYSSRTLRIINEVGTLFLFALIFVVVLRDGLNTIWAMVGLVLLAGLLMAGIKVYERRRKE